jgi:hypothetical protein
LDINLYIQKAIIAFLKIFYLQKYLLRLTRYSLSVLKLKII